TRQLPDLFHFRVISGPLPQSLPQTQHAFSPKVSPKVLGFSPNLFGEPRKNRIAVRLIYEWSE
ncbi:hypothetical protein, partial [Galactobacillus timonensis]|uniref:hypothetical protein n=1 Tax=Galactobacillus timonensis TaxID=2041840 RepID=UPI0023F350AC